MSEPTMRAVLERWGERKNIPGPADPFGIGWQRCSDDMRPIYDRLVALVDKLDYALNGPVNNWRVDGKSIVCASDAAPLIHDHSAHSQSLALVAEALNFVVRRKALEQFAKEFAAILYGPEGQ